MFRGIDAVVNAVGPILRKHSVIVIPDVENISYDLVQTSTGKAATACRILARYTFYAMDGSSVSARVAAEAWDHGDKAAPKAMSVAFRTALLQALALPTDEPDPDSHSYEQDAPKAEAKPTRRMSLAVTDAQLQKMHASFNELGITDREQRLAYTSNVLGRDVESSKELTKADASKLIERLTDDLAHPFERTEE
jgi:hypothetical protein